MKKPASNQKKLLYEICMFDFVCLEMQLYLDTHPKDTEALRYFQYYNRLYKQAKREYATKFEPLCVDDLDVPGNSETWRWSQTFRL